MGIHKGVRSIVLVVMVLAVGWTFYSTFGKNKSVIKQGEPVPDFVAQTVQGSSFQLSQLKGKGVLINFWGTWCPPCREEMPALQQAAQEFKARNVEVIAVNVGESEVPVTSYLRANEIAALPVAFDQTKEISRSYQVGPLPTSFFIKPDGTLYEKIEGGMTLEKIRANMEQIAP